MFNNNLVNATKIGNIVGIKIRKLLIQIIIIT